MKSDRVPVWMGVAGVAATALIAAVAMTWRWRHDQGTADIGATHLARGRCIFAFWHARLLPMAWVHRHCGAAVLVSRHRDGELIARVVRRLGYVTVRGSSTRGGAAGALALLDAAHEGRALAITPDGPRGPARVVKPGLIHLASRAGIPVIPAAAAAAPCAVLRSWDGFRVPMPFARVGVAYGAPIPIPSRVDAADVPMWASRIATAIDAATRTAALAAGEPA